MKNFLAFSFLVLLLAGFMHLALVQLSDRAHARCLATSSNPAKDCELTVRADRTVSPAAAALVGSIK